MQWPTSVLVFPLFSTLLALIKKRAAPYPHAITTSDIYYSCPPFISSMEDILLGCPLSIPYQLKTLAATS
jgi:hypothetical protein